MSLSRPFGRAWRLLVFLLAPVVAAACISTDFDSTTEPVTGNGIIYALATVDNQQLPVTFTDANQVPTEVRKGALTLSPDSSFIFSLALRTNTTGIPGTTVTTVRGTYTRDGTAITLRQAAETAFNGSYAPNNVVLNLVAAQVLGQSFVFVR